MFLDFQQTKSVSAFQGGRRAHPDPLVRRLLAEERDGQACVEAGRLRRAADRLAPPQLLVGLCGGGLGRRVGRHHQQGPRRLRQGQDQRERRREKEGDTGLPAFSDTIRSPPLRVTLYADSQVRNCKRVVIVNGVTVTGDICVSPSFSRRRSR